MSKELNPTEHPALATMEALWLDGYRATEIVKHLADNGQPPVKVDALARYGQRNWNKKLKLVVTDTTDLEASVQELESTGLKVSKISRTEALSHVWEKQEDGSNKQVLKPTSRTTIEVKPDDAPSFERATLPNITVVVPPTRGNKPDGIGLAISIPDMQIGYYRDVDGNLTTIHDERVLNVQNQIMAYLQSEEEVDLVVWQGDNADFAELGKYRTSVGYMGNTQLTIDRLGSVVATQRAITPDAELVYIDGNHESRMTNLLVDKVPDLVGLSRAGDREPVMEIGYLCRFDEYDVEHIDSWPNGSYWANKGLEFIHGSDISSAPGATAAKALSKGHSVVYGHTHRQELVQGLVNDYSGPRSIFAGSAGCSCKTDGSVPSTKTGINPTGGQNKKAGTENWHQGMMIIYFEKDGYACWAENIRIEEGRTIFRGKEYISTVDSEGNQI